MVDPASYRPATGSIPESPGVYRFRDSQDRVVYVGKAKNLRSRLNSYFADVGSLHPRTQTMVCSASRVDWTVVATEVEALQLEYNWIKEFDPRFNVKYRDDKSYPYLAVTVSDEVPACDGDARCEAKGRPVFRPLLPCLGHPRNPRPAAPCLSDADVFERRLPARRADRPALPVGAHRQVRSTVRRLGLDR